MPVEKGTIIDIDSVELHGLTPEQEAKLKTILHKYKGVFSTGPGDFGCTPEMSFRIDTGDHEPVAARYHPIPIGYQEGVRELLDGMMNNGVLEHWQSLEQQPGYRTQTRWILKDLRQSKGSKQGDQEHDLLPHQPSRREPNQTV